MSVPAAVVETYREARARGEKARKLADVLMRPEIGLAAQDPRTAEAAIRELTAGAWHCMADLAGTREPSRKTQVLVAGIVRQRMENRP